MAAAAGDGAVKPLQCAMKLANGAIELDTGNRPREAYTEYLRSIHYISQVLLEEVETTKEGGEIVAPDTSKMLKLAEQCLERAQSTAAKLGKTHLKPAMPVAAPVPSSTSRHRRVYSDEGGKLSPFLPPEIFQKLQVVESQSSAHLLVSGRVLRSPELPGIPGLPRAWTAACHYCRELTPLEEASLAGPDDKQKGQKGERRRRSGVAIQGVHGLPQMGWGGRCPIQLSSRSFSGSLLPSQRVGQTLSATFTHKETMQESVLRHKS